MVVLALLNLGGEEVLLILVLFLVLFGAERVPDVARQLGRARAELERARREVAEAVKSEDEKALDEQLRFEAAREHHVAQQDAEGEAVRRAAAALGIDATGKDEAALRREIAERVQEGDAAKDAQQ